VADITPSQVHDLLTATHAYVASNEHAVHARQHLGNLFLDVSRQAKVGLRELSVLSGLHHSTIRAMIQRAAGPGMPEGWEQLQLPVLETPVSAPQAVRLLPLPPQRPTPTRLAPATERVAPALAPLRM
jgi:hypothetical protein